MIRVIALTLLACLWIGGSVRAGTMESAHLVAVVLPGKLEIVTPEVVHLEKVLDEQVERELKFLLEGIVINDLDGNGLGWSLKAFPSALVGEWGTELEAGGLRGFKNASEPANVTTPSPDELVYALGGGVSGFTVDYGISYDVPEDALAGRYSGQVRFEITTQ